MALSCLISALTLLAAVRSLRGEIVFTTTQPGIIFYRAGAGAKVMTVHAQADDGRRLIYSLSGGDAEYFNIDPDSGLITTNRTILKSIGEAYLTSVLARTTDLSESQFKLLSIRIHVTIRNEYPPSFNQTRYHSILYRGETPGSVVTVTQAFDRDLGDGAKLVYSIVPGNYSSYFKVNRKNGTVTLLRPFPPVIKQLSFAVRVKDFGSPQYETDVDVRVYIRDVSAPRRFCMKHTNSSSALLCWQRSLHGAVTNYRLDYWPSRYPYNRSHVLMDVGKENVRCYVLTGLTPWTWYNARVYAHNFEEFSPSSAILVFQADNNGFYGQRCDFVDVCRTESPCQNGATCRNISTGRYHCDCAAGWSRTNCTYYDPCVENPCLNNGLCLNRGNNQSVCICSGGHYGTYCEKHNPCAVKPCKNQGRCSNLTQTTYQCTCREGFWGHDCKRFDPCVRSRCDEHGTCRNLSDTEYMCECERGYHGVTCSVYNPCILEAPCRYGACEFIRSHEHMCRCNRGYFGSACQHYNPCVVVTCGNGGTCRNMTNDRYRCECPRGYYGDHCEYYNPCVEDPCQNAGHCRNVSNANYRCTCTAGYFGRNCETEVVECASNPCQNSGQCVDRVNGYTCRCRHGYSGAKCEIVAKCNQLAIETKEGSFVWPRTQHGITMNISCPYGARNDSVEGTAYATCSLAQHRDVTWSGIDVSRCKELGAVQAEAALRQLNSLTANPSNMTADTVNEAATTLERLIDYATKHRDVAVQMMSVLSSLMDADAEILRLSSANYSASERFRGVIDNYTANAVINNATDSIEIVSRNLRIKVFDKVVSGNEQDVQYQPATNLTEVHGELTHITTEGDLQLRLPDEALRVATSNETNSTLRIQFVTYQNSKFFVTKEKENVTASGKLENRTVLSASIKDRNITNLTKPVLIRFPVVEKNKVPRCVYWDESDKAWSTVGMKTKNGTDDDGALCEAYHLTNFAILLDPSPSSIIDEVHKAALSYISYIGCGLSVLGLSLTLLSYALFPCLHREKSGKILINLCSSMLLMNVSFLLGAHEGSAKYNGLCLAVAIFLHYFVLSTLLWMGVEAVHMYHVLIRIFGSYEERFLIKRCAVAWGIPVLVVGITVAVDVSNYKSKDDFCRLNYDDPYVYYISFLGPSCLILFINAIIFIMLTRVILRPKLKSCKGKVGSSDDPKVTAAQVRGAITVMVLLGVTWIFGALAIGDAKLIFSYIFCIANSLQGFLIFIFRCFMYPEARMAWIQLFKQGTLKKRRGIPRSADTSSKGYDVKGHSRSSDEMSASHTFVTQTNLLNKSNVYKSRFKTRGNNSQKNLLSSSPKEKNVDPNMEYVTLEKLQENRSLINTETVSKADDVRSSNAAGTRPGELTRL